MLENIAGALDGLRVILVDGIDIGVGERSAGNVAVVCAEAPLAVERDPAVVQPELEVSPKDCVLLRANAIEDRSRFVNPVQECEPELPNLSGTKTRSDGEDLSCVRPIGEFAPCRTVDPSVRSAGVAGILHGKTVGRKRVDERPFDCSNGGARREVDPKIPEVQPGIHATDPLPAENNVGEGRVAVAVSCVKP